MADQYTKIKLKQLEKNKGDLVSGPFGSDISAKFFVDEGVPVIRGNNMKSKEKPFIDDGFVFITYQKAAKLIKCKAIEDDLIFTAVGTIGQVAIIPKQTKYEYYIISNKQIRLRVNKKIADPYFVYYQLSSDSIRTYLEGQNRGSSVPLLNLAEIRNVSILLPPLTTQRKIASILSAYDELIENNTQRIKLLEEMAEEFYKEWFVRVRFPGYENTRFFNEEDREVLRGTVGALPEGWKKVKLGERFDISLGGTPARENEGFWNGDIPWINSGKVNDLRVIEASEYITELGLQKSATKIIRKKTTVLAITGATLGQVSMLEIDSCTNQSVVGVKDPNNEIDEYVFLVMKEKIKDLINYAGGGAQQHINKAIVEEAEILMPESKILKEFISVVKPMFDLLSNLMFKSKLLQKTRDLLLPRLISGKLSVEHLIEETESLSMAAESTSAYETSK